MSFFSPEISERRSVTSEACEMRLIVQQAVDTRRSLGYDRAVDGAARDLNMKPRRVLAILRSEIKRVWADELSAARRWYRLNGDRQARLDHEQAALRRALIQEWESTWPNG
ncbi:hypothetical protein HN018_06740 [Lichenicola cladoniae]|uniref:Uncharacterized protein n=1 Tax=Lichenicola cladoniae TaxID=1484109 RepID=A0A6M8HN16_9PROT|nr:hypothetical protein [Lichenicola cladoniae]NPD67269.1 hypothetical protein [Acetobacteraceae bacterium]QKE89774.1 hypothetical protein HN018_06740 [Lichenicola cladoniae]